MNEAHLKMSIRGNDTLRSERERARIDEIVNSLQLIRIINFS